MPLRILTAILLLALTACHPQAPITGPLPQSGYLWQRAWTPAVIAAFQESQKHLDSTVILGAEIAWDNKTPHAIRADIPWSTLKESVKPIALGLRIAPYPGPFSRDDAPIRTITQIATSLISEARDHGVSLSEFQIDFDCAQKKLPGYCDWMHTMAQAIHPLRVVITTLPAWLDEPAFPILLHEVDGYVLQVHSVPTLQESGHAVLCDPALAQKWVGKASRLGFPFSVALPTYNCLAGYGPDGRLISVAMDGVDPAWPPDTHVLLFGTHADAIASLVHQWQSHRPPGMQGILWYRVPVATDQRNWKWPTLLAVMAGRNPTHHLEAMQEGQSPIDLSLLNTGEADDDLNCTVTITWHDARLTASDPLPGWTLNAQNNQATFTTTQTDALRLSPGAKLGIGWLRFDKTPGLQINVTSHETSSP